VEEAAADSHGRDILHLPAEPLLGDPTDALKALYAGGVRFVLLVGGSAAFGLAGFDITRIAREGGGLRVEWRRATDG
jgi:hypothetical protein